MQKIRFLFPCNPVNSHVKPPCTWAVGISVSVRAQSLFFTRRLGPWESCDVQDVGEGPSASRAAWLPDMASTLNKSTMVPQSPRAPPSSHAWGAGPVMEPGKLVGSHHYSTQCSDLLSQGPSSHDPTVSRDSPKGGDSVHTHEGVSLLFMRVRNWRQAECPAVEQLREGWAFPSAICYSAFTSTGPGTVCKEQSACVMLLGKSSSHGRAGTGFVRVALLE